MKRDKLLLELRKILKGLNVGYEMFLQANGLVVMFSGVTLDVRRDADGYYFVNYLNRISHFNCRYHFCVETGADLFFKMRKHRCFTTMHGKDVQA